MNILKILAFFVFTNNQNFSNAQFKATFTACDTSHILRSGRGSSLWCNFSSDGTRLDHIQMHDATGRTFKPSLFHKSRAQGQYNYYINIHNVTIKNSNKYSCAIRLSPYNAPLRVFDKTQTCHYNVTAPPKLQMNDSFVQVGRNITLICRIVEANPVVYSVLWFYEDAQIGKSVLAYTYKHSYTVVTNNRTYPTTPRANYYTVIDVKLRLRSVQLSQDGVYTCKAKTSLGKNEASARLLVYVLRLQLNSVTIKEGENAILKCVVLEAKPRVDNFEWYLNGQKLKWKRPNLSIVKAVKTAPIEAYKCKVSNIYGGTAFRIATLTILSPPKVEFESLTVNQGEDAILECEVILADPKVDRIEWYYQNKRIPNQNNELYHIPRVRKKSHEGTYQCQAINSEGKSAMKTASLTVNQDHIRPVGQLKSITVLVGETAVFFCRVIKAYPPVARYRWRLIYTSNKKKDLPSYKEQHIIKNVQPSHAGKYSCRLGSSSGKWSVWQVATLTVHVIPKVKMKSIVAKEGTHATLTCEINNSNPPADIVWYFKGNMQPYPNENKFVIRQVLRSHSGMYTCIAKNTVGRANATATLTVLAAPDAVVTFSHEYFLMGMSASIHCSANPDKAFLSLYLNDDLWKKTKTLTTELVKKIPSIGKEHEGTYKCVAENSGGKSDISQKLRLSVPPVVLAKTKVVKEGTDAVIKCRTWGFPMPKVTWYKDGNKIDSTDDFDLYIYRVTRHDAGEYICSSTNVAATRISTASLHVIYKPTVRVDDVIVVEKNSAKFECKVNAYPQVTNITWYKNDDMLSTGDARLTTYTIPKVIKDTSEGIYRCVASNTIGKGMDAGILVVVPLSFAVYPESTSALVNSDVRLKCSVVVSNKKINMKWLFNDRVIINGDKVLKGTLTNHNFHHNHRYDDGDYDLLLTKVQLKNSGTYTCQANSDKMKAHLIVEAEPGDPTVIAPKPINNTYTSGKRMNLTCASTGGSPVPSFMWLINGARILNSSSNSISSVSIPKTPGGTATSFISILLTVRHHTSIIKCSVTNSVLKNEYKTTEYTPLIQFSPVVSVTTYGNNFKRHRYAIICKWKANPKTTDVKWSKDGASVTKTSQHDVLFRQITDDSSALSIIKLKSKHAGIYVCTVSNHAGETSANTTVTVRGQKNEGGPNGDLEGGITFLTWLIPLAAVIFVITFSLSCFGIKTLQKNKREKEKDVYSLTIDNTTKNEYSCHLPSERTEPLSRTHKEEGIYDTATDDESPTYDFVDSLLSSRLSK